MGKIDAQRIDFEIPDSPDRPCFVLHPHPNQTANLVEFRDTQGNVTGGVGPDGRSLFGPTVPSNPPPGHFRVTNLYVDSVTGKLVVEYDDGS